ncbi:MAG: glutathione transferase GstA [Deltaproteobacteria bacterium]|nr:glutathione transferase GstA [Deltaproteobacteria bacterium]
MKLYYSSGACSLAPHIALREAERRFDLERVDLKTRRTASGRDFTEINPKGYVPCLELAPGETLTEAQVILQYIGDLVPDQRLIAPAGTLGRYRLQEWLAFIATELHKQFGPLFKATTPQAVQATQRGKIGERMTYVQEALSDRAFLMGETFSVADCYLFVMLQWCDKLHIDLSMWPILDDYEERVSHRPAVEAAMASEGVHGRHRFKRSA